jgi:hypothetical protein
MLTSGASGSSNVLARVAAWWREWVRTRAAWDELERCGADLEFIAHDVGLSPAELTVIAAKRPDAADLLHQRLAALGMDHKRLAQTHPETLRDLEKVCTLCGDKRRCLRDLAPDRNPPGWRDYCTNVPTLDALRGEGDPAERMAEDGADAPCPALYRCFPRQY